MSREKGLVETLDDTISDYLDSVKKDLDYDELNKGWEGPPVEAAFKICKDQVRVIQRLFGLAMTLNRKHPERKIYIEGCLAQAKALVPILDFVSSTAAGNTHWIRNAASLNRQIPALLESRLQLTDALGDYKWE